MSGLCLIDAHSLCYRAFFAIKAGLATSYGQPTNAVYGFINMLNRILKEVDPEYIVICFDTPKPTFREKKFAEYKIHRPSMPDDLRSQIPIIREVIAAYNITMIEKDGFEADDIIACLSRRARGKKIDTVIVTSDKDMLQLVGEGIKVYNPYKGDGVYFDAPEVKVRFGVEPERIADVLALMGDSVDNIPGVKGIGEKTATSLIAEFNDVENLIRRADTIRSEKMRDLIKKNTEVITLSKELAQLSGECDISFCFEDAHRREYNQEKLYGLFQRLEFKTLLKSLGGPAQQETGASACEGIFEGKDVVSDTAALKKEIAAVGGFSFSFAGQDKNTVAYVYPGKATVYEVSDQNELCLLFGNGTYAVIGEDIKSCKHRCAGVDCRIQGKLFDIVIAAYLLDPARTDYSLDALSQDYLKIGPFMKEGLFEKKKPVLIFELKKALEKELHEKKLDALFYELEIPLIDVLFCMERNGFKIDTQFLKEFSQTLQKKLDTLIGKIHALAETEFNINSPKQLREVLFTKLKLPVVKKTKTGPSTDEEVLHKLAPRHELPSLILEYRQITKLKTTYVDVLPELCEPKTKRLHSSFLQTGTETGRLSSANPNIQNIPIKTELGRKIRQAFIAGSADSLLLSADYSQIELRILAHLSGDPTLIDAFKSDCDIHKATAALIYQVEVDAVQDEMREIAKRVNFGVIYGMSSFGLAKDLNISRDVAEDFIATYFVRYAKVREYIDAQIAMAQKEGYVVTMMGRRRYLPHINSPNMSLRQFSERQAVNASIQGSAADLIKRAMVDIQRELEKEKMQAKMVSQVHDELVFDFPAKEKKQLIAIVREKMEGAIALNVPVKASLKIGPNWADMESVR